MTKEEFNRTQSWWSAEYEHLRTDVSENKTDIQNTKDKLNGLEDQIVEITDKMKKFKDTTDQIIEAITRKIQEAEGEYQCKSTSPIENNSDITMNKVKTSVQNTFDHFALT